MSIRALRTLVAIAQHGSFARAAEAVHLTQSAVSLHVRALEEEFNARLFDRSKRLPVLTDAGHLAVERAREVLSLYDSIATELGEASELRGRLKLGVIQTTLTDVLPSALAALSQQHPHLRVNVTSGMSAELAVRIEAGELDAAVTTEPVKPYPYGLVSKPLYQEGFWIIAPEGIDTSDSRRMLLEESFIRFDRRAWAGRLIDRELRRQRITGSTRVGELVANAAAKKIIPATLELGGKSANIVFPDANWDKAVEGAVLAILWNQGQVCESGARLFVHESIYERFLAELKHKFEAVRVGDPLNPDTMMGAQVSKSQMERILGYVDIAKQEGAEVLIGGGRLTGANYDAGFFIQPTILVGVRNDMRVAYEEIFGPVLCVIPFKDEAEVIAMANDSEYGLAGAVWTQDINRALRVARAVETGRMWVNTYHEIPAHAPFGGYKKSGLGRETHKSMLEAYSQKKNIYVSLNEAPHGLF